MKKNYAAPEVLFLAFSEKDIILTSDDGIDNELGNDPL